MSGARQIWDVFYRNGLSGPVQVYASDASDAEKQGYAAWQYQHAAVDTKFKKSDVVAAVRPAADQTVYRGAMKESQNKADAGL